MQPSIDENFYIAFGDNDPDEKFILDYLMREDIQTNNIRVLKKLKWTLNNLRPYIENFLPIIRHQIIQEIIFISLSKLDKKFPVNLTKLLSLGDYSKILAGKVDEDRNLYLVAANLGYSGSPISDEIIALVETSVCNYVKFTEAGKQLNDREENEKIRERLSEAYAPYSESFGSSEEELRENFRKFLNKYCLFIGLRELGEIEEIAKAIHLDLSDYKRNWLKHQVDNSGTFEALNSLKPLFQDFLI